MSRKFKQVEDAVTSRVMPLLDKKLYGWTLTEQQPPFIEDTTKPDMMAVRKGRETIAIEAKAYDNPDTLRRFERNIWGRHSPPITSACPTR